MSSVPPYHSATRLFNQESHKSCSDNRLTASFCTQILKDNARQSGRWVNVYLNLDYSIGGSSGQANLCRYHGESQSQTKQGLLRVPKYVGQWGRSPSLWNVQLEEALEAIQASCCCAHPHDTADDSTDVLRFRTCSSDSAMPLVSTSRYR